MFCPKCGTQLQEGDRFCPTCGRQLGAKPAAPQEQAAPQPAQPVTQQPPVQPDPQQPVQAAAPAGGQSGFYQPPQPPVPPVAPAAAAGGKKKGGALKIVAALVVVAALAVGTFAFVLPAIRKATADPKTVLTDSLSATSTQVAAAQEKMLSDLGLSGAMDAIRQGPSQQTIGVTLGDLPYDAAMLSGAGFTLVSQYDPAQHVYAGDLSLQYGAMDLGQLQYYVNPEMGALACPTLLDDSFYGISWDTLRELSGGDPEAEMAVDMIISMISTDYASYAAGLSQDTMNRLDAARDALFAASTVTSDGAQSVTTLSGTESLEQYTVQVPGSAVGTYLSSAFEAVMEDPMIAPLMDLALESEGMSREAFYEEFAEIEQFFQGTVTMTAHLRDGYLASIRGAVPLTNDSGAVLTIDFLCQLGTQESILGGTLLEVTMSDSTGTEIVISYSSQGQRGSGSVYEDTSRLSFQTDGEEVIFFNLYTYYDAQQSGDNFSFQLDVGEYGYALFTVSADGSLSADSAAQSLSADLTTALSVEGESISMDLLYAAEPLDQITIDGSDFVAIDQMSSSDLAELEALAEQNLYMLLMQFYYGM